MNVDGELPALLKASLENFNLGRFAEAETGAADVVQHMPAWGDAWKILGVARFAQAKDAMESLGRAAALLPDDADLHAYLGAEFDRTGDVKLAERHLARAIALNPQCAQGLYRMGMLLARQDRLPEAIANLRRAALVPGAAPGALHALGEAAFKEGNFEESERAFRQSLELHPSILEARVGLAILLLLKGDLRNGFRLYESRWQVRDMPQGPRFSFPQWDGKADLHSKQVLYICAEQGFGDGIQFVRFAKNLERRGAIVSLAVHRELARLFHGMGICGSIFTDGAALPSFDYYCYALSVPTALEIDIDNIPFAGGYLSVPVTEGAKTPSRQRFKVGLAWQGNPGHKNDLQRSLGLVELLPLFDLADVEFISLQKEIPAKDAELAAGLALGKPSEPLEDFFATAQAMMELDLVISIDSSVAHLAGALGKEAWIMLPRVPDWRWLLDRNDSPWYDSVRLFRQPERGNWASVIKEIAAELKQRVALQRDNAH